MYLMPVCLCVCVCVCVGLIKIDVHLSVKSVWFGEGMQPGAVHLLPVKHHLDGSLWRDALWHSFLWQELIHPHPTQPPPLHSTPSCFMSGWRHYPSPLPLRFGDGHSDMIDADGGVVCRGCEVRRAGLRPLEGWRTALVQRPDGSASRWNTLWDHILSGC